MGCHEITSLEIRWQLMTNNDIGWQRMACNMFIKYSKTTKINIVTQFFSWCHDMVSIDIRWHQMTINDIIRHSIARDDIRRQKITKNIFIEFDVTWDNIIWHQMTSDDRKRQQMTEIDIWWQQVTIISNIFKSRIN